MGLILPDALLLDEGAHAEDADVVKVVEVVFEVELVEREGHDEAGEVGREVRVAEEGECEVGAVDFWAQERGGRLAGRVRARVKGEGRGTGEGTYRYMGFWPRGGRKALGRRGRRVTMFEREVVLRRDGVGVVSILLKLFLDEIVFALFGRFAILFYLVLVD